MTTLTLDIPVDVYQRLAILAAQHQQPIEDLVQGWLAEQSRAVTLGDVQARSMAVLRAAGLLAEPPTPSNPPHMLTDQERTALAERLVAHTAPPLSDVIIAERAGR